MPRTKVGQTSSPKLHIDVTRPQQDETTVAPVIRGFVSPLIKVDQVSQTFGSQRALDHVSVTITPGEFVVVVGRSGAGKTTLLRMLSRAITVGDGELRVGGVDIGALRGSELRGYRARVGMIYQQFNLVKRLSVMDNVLIGRLAHLSGWPRVAALVRWFDASERAVACRALAHVGLLDRAWQRADTLSGGEQQRVAIAKILAQAPRLVLGDEPVASLDLHNGELVMATLREITTAAGLTVVTTLHHVEYARRYADRVLGLRDGRLVFDGPPEDLTDGVLTMIFGECSTPESRNPSLAIADAGAQIAS